ncbi:MAG: hypothetical protein Tsb009_26690 [Planctomycetaceae bacterium]
MIDPMSFQAFSSVKVFTSNKKSWTTWLLIFACVCGIIGSASRVPAAKQPKQSAPKFELKDGDRVVFLGNTLIERAQKYGYFELVLTAAHPDRKIIFRNLGWDGDTVWAESRGIFDAPAKGYQRMLAHVGRIKPTVIFLGYGNNEAFAGIAGLPKFIAQYNKLLDDLTKASAKGVRFVFIAPVNHFSLGKPLPSAAPFNAINQHYIKAVQQIAQKRNAPVLDFNGLIDVAQQNYNDAKLGRTAFKPTIYQNGWTHNGLHWRHNAYKSFASEIAVSLLGRYGMWAVHAKADGTLVNSHGVEAKVSKIKDGLKLNVTGREYHLGTILYLARDLPEGTWELRSGNRVLNRQNVGKKGWNFTLKSGPEIDRYEKLRKAIIEKNMLYFHSWRPQNVTYLFLFRKHEQGQNAKEVKEFEKLVAEKEQEIDRLKKPVTYTYELIRVK